MRTRIKFCGITRPGDARLAGELGVDAVGLIFAAASKRRLDVDTARAICAALPPMVSTVALFMDNEPQLIERVLRAVRPHLLQFHGSETEIECQRWDVPYLRAIPMRSVDDASGFCARYPGAAGFVLDSHRSGAAGGTGEAFDWAQVPAQLSRPWLLAGGLAPDTVAAAIAATHPWGVDVSSGIESSPGIKDGEKMLRFVQEVQRVDHA
ncbi:MAG: phosphoribosylanthranilate isomerase [Gammaproteobacteria bacterium HGW-Gammaproteobacteria-4]|jgi:phosphoribosylanthranilate isomerase|nr:MAG: phosphoribosylanthranilate isomerase [Gammaproteobacteria bacterium HGW-Gammaproteobacteria-4]